MVSREIFAHEPTYEKKYKDIFGKQPENPTLQVYIPAEYMKDTDTRQSIMAPIWAIEKSRVLPSVVEKLRADGVHGDFVEFGVSKGGSFCRMLRRMRGTGIVNKWWGFDSFDGLPEFKPGQDQKFFKRGQFKAAKEAAEATIRAAAEGEDIELVEGLFGDSLPTCADRIKDIAFVRIDCDLYVSSVDAFNFLRSRLVDGAILWFDDWTFDATTGETRAFFEFAEAACDLYDFKILHTVAVSVFVVQVFHKGSALAKRQSGSMQDEDFSEWMSAIARLNSQQRAQALDLLTGGKKTGRRLAQGEKERPSGKPRPDQ